MKASQMEDQLGQVESHLEAIDEALQMAGLVVAAAEHVPSAVSQITNGIGARKRTVTVVVIAGSVAILVAILMRNLR